MATKNSLMSKYSDLNTIPSIVGIALAVAAAVQFNGLEITFIWFDWTPDGVEWVIVSLAAYAIAFMSSETRDFQHYEQKEQFLIAAGPALVLANEYVTEIADVVVDNDPWGGVVFFVIVMASWGVVSR